MLQNKQPVVYVCVSAWLEDEENEASKIIINRTEN